MTTFKEDAYEKAVLSLFEEMGYERFCGYDIDRDYRNPMLNDYLQSSLARLNPSFTASDVETLIMALRSVNSGSLVQRNEAFMDFLQNGVPMRVIDKKSASGTATVGTLAKLIDFENVDNNHFAVVNQWTVEEFQKKRCDVVVFVNGLPLVVVELKSATAKDATIDDAYKQIRNYQQALPTLFTYNAFNVISDMSETRAGTITSKQSRYMEWKTENGDYETTMVADYTTFFKGIFEKKRFLDILHNFICFDKNSGANVKILTAYHQYYAVNRAIERTFEAIEKDGRIGVFWHTQGSGKSLSMVFFAHQLVQKLPNVTIVVVTDRKDLDNQLYAQFGRCQDFIRQRPEQAESKKELRELLHNREAGGVIFTTIQKFEEDDEALSDRKNIIVVTDEAHRSQYGEEHWDNKSMSMKKGQARKMREALPNASFIGFTGTPISDRDRDTEAVFGDYIDVYDMTQAVQDGATRPVYYESRVVNLNLDEDTLKLLDREFDELADLGATDEQLREAKRKNSRLEMLLGSDETIDSLVRDILKHYEDNREQECTGKAMIVALTRGIAIKIYKKILELRPAWTEKVKVVMSSSNKDPEEWQQIIGNEKYKQELARKFKDDGDEMKIAIVRDMWLTGFDVPSLATMYVYKAMKGHNLMQAIARVNRVFPEKEGGLIVDYIGIAQALKNAMKQYTTRDQTRFGDPDIAKTARVKWQEFLEQCRIQIHGFDYSAFISGNDKEKADAIVDGVNFLVNPLKEQKKKDFIEFSRQLHNATTLCRSLLTDAEKMEACYFDAVRVMLAKLSQKGKLTKQEINDRISALIQQSIRSEGVINLFSSQSKEFSLFDPAFLKELQDMKQKNLALELLSKLIKEKIKTTSRINVVQSELFSDLLNQTLSSYLKGMLTNEEVIQELIKLAEQLKQTEQLGDELGLTQEEKAFYDALSTPEGVRQAFSDDEFVALTKELTEVLHKNRTIDWNHKESARAKMRVLVKRLLKKYKYPPTGAEQALDVVMRQCDSWADNDDNFVETESKPKMTYTLPESDGVGMAAEEQH